MRIETSRDGDRIMLAVMDGEGFVLGFRLTDDQALKLAGELMRAAGKEILIDAAKVVAG